MVGLLCRLPVFGCIALKGTWGYVWDGDILVRTAFVA